MLDFGMALIAQRLGQALMDLLPEQPPGGCVVHQKHVVAFADHLAYFIFWAITGGSGFLIHELLDDAAICKNDCCPSPEFEGVHASILLGPFSEPVLWLST